MDRCVIRGFPLVSCHSPGLVILLEILVGSVCAWISYNVWDMVNVVTATLLRLCLHYYSFRNGLCVGSEG